jgi:simple sugar transport system permease protein
MAGFVAAWKTDSLIVGIAVAMIVGALVALLIAFSSIKLKQDQVAIGFVLTLLCADLARFLGQDYTRIPGPQISRLGVPVLEDIPVVGQVLFDQNPMVYFSFILVIVTWIWLFRTHWGMAHRAIGERPEAAFARGTKVNFQRYVYTCIGGALIGVAGAAYSLNVKPGLSNPPSMQGDGWIALAIVIFGGWHPFRVVLGAYLFALLRAISSNIQTNGLEIMGHNIEFNFVLLNGLPWTLMIITLLLISSGSIDRLLQIMPRPVQRRLRSFLRSNPPKALGTRFDGDG